MVWVVLKFTAKLVFGSDQGTGVEEVFMPLSKHGFRVPSPPVDFGSRRNLILQGHPHVTGYDFSRTVHLAQRSEATRKQKPQRRWQSVDFDSRATITLQGHPHVTGYDFSPTVHSRSEKENRMYRQEL